jgi:hypothetical protein
VKERNLGTGSPNVPPVNNTNIANITSNKVAPKTGKTTLGMISDAIADFADGEGKVSRMTQPYAQPMQPQAPTNTGVADYEKADRGTLLGDAKRAIFQGKIGLETDTPSLTDLQKPDWAGTPSSFQLQTQGISNIPEFAGIFETVVAQPYRQYIAPYISAALLVSDPTWRENNPDVTGNYLNDVFGSAGLFGGKATPAFEKALADSRKAVDPNTSSDDFLAARVYSPGRSLTLLASDLIPGEQGTEKLNWEDGKEVDEYYRQGLPRLVSGGIDLGFTWLDPWIIGTKGAAVAKTVYVTRPVTPSNVKTIIKEMQEAKDPAVRNSFSPVLDKIEEAASPETFNPSVLDNIGMINGGSGANLTKTLIEAQIIGGRDLASDVLQVAADLTYEKLDEITAKSVSIGAQLEHLLKQEELIKNYTNDLLNPDIVTPPMSSVESLRKYIPKAPKAIDDLTTSERALASYLDDEVLKKLRSQIAEKSDLAKVYLDMTTVAGTALNQTVPVTALRKLSERQIIAAQRADDTYWDVQSMWDPRGLNRVAYWVNPSGRLHEVPRGMMQVSGPAAFRADREVAARIRDLGKITKMSGKEQRDLYNNFKMLGTKSEMFGYADELLVRTQFDIAKKHIPQLAQLTSKQQQLFRSIFNTLNLQTTKTRGQVIQEASGNNYTLLVDNANVKIPQLEGLINDIANDYANEVSKGARNVATPEEIKFVTEELIKGTPTTTSQVPGIHFAPRANDIEDFIVTYKEDLVNTVDNILDGTLKENNIASIIAEPNNYLTKNIFSGITAKEFGEFAGHSLARAAKGWQDQIWKPLTLLGFSYTARNVLEGMSRVAMLMAEFHQERGYKYSDMLADYSSSLRPGNRAANNAAYSQWRKDTDDFNDNFKKLTANMSSQQVKAEDIFLNSQDGIALSMKVFENSRLALDNFVTDSAIGKQFLKTVKKSSNLAFKQGIPKGASKDFIDAITTGDYRSAWRLSVSMDTEQLAVNFNYIKNQSLETLREIEFYINKNNLPVGTFNLAKDLRLSLSHINSSADAAQVALLERAKARGVLEGYAAKFTRNKPVKIRRGEGQFEPIPGSGFFVDDAYRNNIGQIMRGQISSAATTTSTILNVRQQIAQTAWHKYAKEDLIFPFHTVAGEVSSKINKNWAEAFSDYMNNIYYNDALSVKILSAKKNLTPEKLKVELEKWLASKDSLAWREDLNYAVSRYPSRIDGKSKYVSVVEERMNEISKVLPVVGANGEDLYALRQKVLDRTFTNADSLAIPEIDRMPVNGVVISSYNDAAFNVPRVYRSMVNSIFKYIGTIPEDNFVRFPFYRTVYRNEVRRRVNSLVAKGKDPVKYEEQILNVARQEAYKQTIERLYSIERYTDLGQAMQYLSPFYMSAQNSARFWAGAVTRNPAIVPVALKVWNIPNAMGVVYDEKGNRIAYDTPWTADNNEIQIGLPASVAKFYGAPKYSTRKASLDLSFQGRTPGVPSLGGAYVDAATVNFMYRIAGTSKDPDLWAMKMGLGPNFIGEKVVPFYQAVKDNPNENVIMRTARALVGYGSQWTPLMAVGSFIDGKANNTFMTRHDSLYRASVIEAERANKVLTAEDHADLLDDATSKTVRSLITEWFLGTIPNPVKGKLKNTQQIERDKANSFIKEYGYEQGILEYAKTLDKKDQSSYLPILAVANVTTDNIFGLYSNTQTIKNFRDNKDLVDRVDKQNASSSVIGYLLNEGNPSEDYSVTSDDYLYRTTVNNKNIKTKIAEVDSYELQRRGYNNDYYPYSIAVDLMRKADAEAGREESADFYQELKDDKKAELELKYPTYALEPTYKTQEAVINDIRTIYAMTSDSNFMTTVGNRSKVVKAGVDYLYELRPVLVDLDQSGVPKIEIDELKLQFFDDYAKGDAEVAKFLQIFFSRDDYTPIDINNVWKK